MSKLVDGVAVAWQELCTINMAKRVTEIATQTRNAVSWLLKRIPVYWIEFGQITLQSSPYNHSCIKLQLFYSVVSFFTRMQTKIYFLFIISLSFLTHKYATSVVHVYYTTLTWLTIVLVMHHGCTHLYLTAN